MEYRPRYEIENGEYPLLYEDKPIMALVYRDATEEEMQMDVPIELTEEATTIEDVVEALGILSEIVLGGE